MTELNTHQTKFAIEHQYGELGGYVFDHLLHTIKLMYQAGDTAQLAPEIESLTLNESEKEHLSRALAESDARAAQQTRQLITNSHDAFARVMGMTGIEVTYAFSGDPNQPNATRTLVLGDISQGGKIAMIDLSPWIKIGAELA